jgi:uncharacterized protein YukE
MAEEFRATPDQLRSQGGGLHDLGSDHLGAASDLRAEVGDGGDALKAGDANSFWEQFTNLTEAVEAQGKWLQQLGDNLKTVADTVQSSDQQS